MLLPQRALIPAGRYTSENHARSTASRWLAGAGVILAVAAFASQASAQSFVATGSLNVARGAHTATLMQDGRVLAAGGLGSGPASLSSSEIFAALFELELAGKVKQLPGKNFVKSF